MNGIAIGLGVCVAVMGLGCLAMAYLALRRMPKTDLGWIREVVYNIQSAYIAGYTDGENGKPKQPGTIVVPPSPPSVYPPAESDEPVIIGEN